MLHCTIFLRRFSVVTASISFFVLFLFTPILVQGEGASDLPSEGADWLWVYGGVVQPATAVVALTATEGSVSNTTLCDVTVQTPSPPTITCPGTVTVNAATGTCAANVDFATTDPATATGFPAPTISYSPASNTSFEVGTTMVTATASNSAGTEACNFNVVVIDNQPPSISCITPITVNVDPGTCTAGVTVPTPTVSDNCNDLGIDLSSTNTVTIEAWIKPDGNQVTYAGILFARNSTTTATGLNFFSNSGTKLGYHWNGAGNTFNWAGGPAVTPDQWNHVALVIEPTQATVYLNGANASVNTVNHAAINLTSLFEIGQDGGTRPFDGSIDEVRVWDYSRTQSQIMSTMNSELTGNEPGLAVYFNFNQGAAGGANSGVTTANELAGGNTGALQNFELSGTASNWVAGQSGFNNALQFDGANDFVQFTYTQPPAITLENDFNNSANASGTYPLGSTSVVWTATDAAGNPAQCTQVITVVDNEDPSFTAAGATNCPGNITEPATSTAGAVVSYPPPLP